MVLTPPKNETSKLFTTIDLNYNLFIPIGQNIFSGRITPLILSTETCLDPWFLFFLVKQDSKNICNDWYKLTD